MRWVIWWADLRAQDAWDVAYYELWDHPDQDDYADLRSFLSTHHSASDVAPVVAGYVNYDLAQQYNGQTPGQFNHTSVLLAQSAVLANGGWLVSRGRLGHVVQRVFPQPKPAGFGRLVGDVDRFHHFAVAYETYCVMVCNKDPVQLPLVMPACPPAPMAKRTRWTFRTTRGVTSANRYDVVHLWTSAVPATRWRTLRAWPKANRCWWTAIQIEFTGPGPKAVSGLRLQNGGEDRPSCWTRPFRETM